METKLSGSRRRLFMDIYLYISWYHLYAAAYGLIPSRPYLKKQLPKIGSVGNMPRELSYIIKVTGNVELFLWYPLQRRISELVAAGISLYNALFLAQHLTAVLGSRTELTVLAHRDYVLTKISLFCHIPSILSRRHGQMHRGFRPHICPYTLYHIPSDLSILFWYT